MFQVKDQLAKIVSCTNVSEKHGKERVPALSIGLSVTGASTMLNHFDESLRGFFFRKEQPKPGALDLDTDELTELRFPKLKNPSWNHEYSGYQLRFCIGATGKEDVLLNDVGIKAIGINPLEGGSVQISFKAHAQPQTEVDHGKLARMLMQECSITLTPPDVDPSLFDGDGDE